MQVNQLIKDGKRSRRLVDHKLRNNMQFQAAASTAGRLIACIKKGIFSSDNTNTLQTSELGHILSMPFSSVH